MINLQQLDKENIWHPFTSLESEDEPLLITEGKGVYLKTFDGRAIIDGVSSWWVNIHGHAHPKIAEAIFEQSKKLEHVIFAGFTHEPAIQLSKNILSILPEKFSKIFFSDNGSTSVEVAIKLAMQFWYNQGIARKKIIAIEGAYHGDTFGSMSVGDRSIFSKPFAPYLFHVDFIDFPTGSNHDKIINDFKALVDTNEVAAFIFEPLIQGAAGMRTYSADLLNTLIGYAQSNNVLCIADEVFTGFGRTGKILASDYLQHKPDIISLSKGITGGFLPLGVTAVSNTVEVAFKTKEVTKTFFHGHSYTANPIACAAANASFELLMTPQCRQQIDMIATLHKKFALQINNHNAIKEVRTIGTIIAIELQSSEETSYTNNLRRKIYTYFLKKDILLRPLGNTFYIVPPYSITEQQLNYIYDAIKNFLTEL